MFSRVILLAGIFVLSSSSISRADEWDNIVFHAVEQSMLQNNGSPYLTHTCVPESTLCRASIYFHDSVDQRLIEVARSYDASDRTYERWICRYTFSTDGKQCFNYDTRQIDNYLFANGKWVHVGSK